MQKYPSPWFTLGLSAILLGPYLLTATYSEPFPAIILPSGHGQLDIKASRIQSIEYRCVVYRNGEAYETTLDSLLKGIPSHYFAHIVQNKLGYTNRTRARRAELENWYVQNLGPVDSLTIATYVRTRNTTDGSLVNAQLIEELTYALDHDSRQ